MDPDYSSERFLQINVAIDRRVKEAADADRGIQLVLFYLLQILETQYYECAALIDLLNDEHALFVSINLQLPEIGIFITVDLEGFTRRFNFLIVLQTQFVHPARCERNQEVVFLD